MGWRVNETGCDHWVTMCRTRMPPRPRRRIRREPVAVFDTHNTSLRSKTGPPHREPKTGGMGAQVERVRHCPNQTLVPEKCTTREWQLNEKRQRPGWSIWRSAWGRIMERRVTMSPDATGWRCWSKVPVAATMPSSGESRSAAATGFITRWRGKTPGVRFR